MKVTNVAAAIMAIAPITGVTASTVLLQCNVGISRLPATLAIGADLFSRICINELGCQHSEAPTISNGLYVGTCLSCPSNVPVVGDCLSTIL